MRIIKVEKVQTMVNGHTLLCKVDTMAAVLMLNLYDAQVCQILHIAAET